MYTHFNIYSDKKTNVHITRQEETEKKYNSTNENKCSQSKMILQTAAEQFIKDCIEIYDQPVQQSRLEDGFLLSQCLSIRPTMVVSNSPSEQCPTSTLDVLLQSIEVSYAV